MMGRYIDADALTVDMSNTVFGIKHAYIVDGVSLTQIKNAPSIDIVFCKECKYASDNKVYGCMCNHFNDNDWDYHRMYANDFCSRGEREGE